MSEPIHSRDPGLLHAELRRRWNIIDSLWRKKHPDGPRLFVTCTYRPPESQAILFQQGKTRADAYQSLHNYRPAYAVDYGFQHNGVYLAERRHIPFYREVGEFAERCGLEWGGRWRIPDYCHVQVAKYTWQMAGYGTEPKWADMDEGTANGLRELSHEFVEPDQAVSGVEETGKGMEGDRNGQAAGNEQDGLGCDHSRCSCRAERDREDAPGRTD